MLVQPRTRQLGQRPACGAPQVALGTAAQSRFAGSSNHRSAAHTLAPAACLPRTEPLLVACCLLRFELQWHYSPASRVIVLKSTTATSDPVAGQAYALQDQLPSRSPPNLASHSLAAHPRRLSQGNLQCISSRRGARVRATLPHY